MKQFAFVLGLVLITNLLNAQTFQIDSIQCISEDGISFSKPRWSPDGKSILATSDNNTGLYLIRSQTDKSQQLTDKQGAGSNAFWLGTGRVGYVQKNKIETIGLPGLKSTDSEDTVIVINAREKSVELVAVQSLERKTITHTKENFYHPVLSPDKKLAVVHLGSEMYVFKTDGSGSMVKIGTGLASSWTADSQYILFFIDRSEDGHSTSNSDLYIVDINGKNRQQITHSEDSWEAWPDISSDGKKITFSDLKTGKLFVGNFRMENK